MGYPSSGTVEVPGTHPHIVDALTSALTDPDGVRAELLAGLTGGTARAGHLCTNAWVFSPDLDQLLLVDHPRFGWTMPGGHLDPGEHPVDGARRELHEETGLHAPLAAPAPVAVVATAIPALTLANGTTQPTHVHYCLSYAFTAEVDADLTGETGQAVAWFDLDRTLPEGFFGDNWYAHRHAAALRAART